MSDEFRLARQKIADAIHEATKKTAEEDDYVVPSRLAVVRRSLRGAGPIGAVPNVTDDEAIRARDEFAAEVCFARLGAHHAKTRLLTLHIIHYLSVRSAAFRLWWICSLPRLQLLTTLCTGWYAPTTSAAAAERAAAAAALPAPQSLWPLLRTRMAAVAEEWIAAYAQHVHTIGHWQQWLQYVVKLDGPHILGRAHGLRLSQASRMPLSESFVGASLAPTVPPGDLQVCSKEDQEEAAMESATGTEEGNVDATTELAMARLLALHAAVLAGAESGQQQPVLDPYSEALGAKSAIRAERRFAAAQAQVSMLARAAGTRGATALAKVDDFYDINDDWGNEEDDEDQEAEENLWNPALPGTDDHA